jgi:hypothetical protein
VLLPRELGEWIAIPRPLGIFPPAEIPAPELLILMLLELMIYDGYDDDYDDNDAIIL